MKFKKLSLTIVIFNAGLITPASAFALPLDCDEILTLVLSIAKTISAFIGVIAIFIMLVAALKFMFSGGNPERVKNARDTVVYAIIGVVVAIFAFNMPSIIASFLISSINTECG